MREGGRERCFGGWGSGPTGASRPGDSRSGGAHLPAAPGPLDSPDTPAPPRIREKQAVPIGDRPGPAVGPGAGRPGPDVASRGREAELMSERGARAPRRTGSGGLIGQKCVHGADGDGWRVRALALLRCARVGRGGTRAALMLATV